MYANAIFMGTGGFWEGGETPVEPRHWLDENTETTESRKTPDSENKGFTRSNYDESVSKNPKYSL